MSRVRMTEAEAAQLGLFQQAKRDGQQAQKKPQPRIKKRREDLPENILVGQIRRFLEAHGWTCHRRHVGTFTPYRVMMALREKSMTLEQAMHNIVRIGEKGEADWMATRPFLTVNASRPFIGITGEPATALQQIFHFECKAPGKKPKPEQEEWLRKKNATGTLAAWFDCYQDDGFGDGHEFVPWYQSRFGDGNR